MKRISNFILVMLLLCSCNNSEFLSDQIDPTPSEVYYLDITYDGTEYHVPCMLDANDSLIYLDKNFRELYENEISKCPNLVVFEKEEGKLVYYTSEEALLGDQKMTYVDEVEFTENGVTTRAQSGDLAGKIIMWDDTGCSGSYRDFYVYYNKFYCCQRLKDFSFNDKCSSLQLWSYIPSNDSVYVNKALVEQRTNYVDNMPPTNDKYATNDLRVVFLGHHNTNYGGVTLYCIAENNGVVHKHENLKKIGWNDKISSIVLRLAKVGVYTLSDVH